MAWLIGLVCVVLVIVSWRIFLPIAMIAGVALVLLFTGMQKQEEKRQNAEQAAAQELRTRIVVAKQNETSEGKEWKVYHEPDPASRLLVARTVSIQSDDGLCYISVQKRVNGTELTGLDCPGIPISSYKEIDVKFDVMQTSQRMRLERYTDSQEVYIPSYQYEYSGQLSYKTFIEMFGMANSLAIYIPAAETFWTRFNLQGASEAIQQLGKPKT